MTTAQMVVRVEKREKEEQTKFLMCHLGTVAKDPETGEVLFEITKDNQTEVLLKGGRGGLGNWNFKILCKPNTSLCPAR